MATKISVLAEDKIGEVFTPLEWAKWMISRWNLADQWFAGAAICDPTAGQGVFAMALIEEAVQRGISLTQGLLARLHLVELHKDHLDAFVANIRARHSIDFPTSSLHACDVLFSPPRMQFDILVGNPPWSNFTDLPSHYKEALKPLFIEYGLVPDRKAVLLGSSRTDISALILKSVFFKLLKDGGEGFFFTPLSLFVGDDAHTGFRDFKTKEAQFSVREIIEFVDDRVFEGVGTSYCAVHFKRDEVQTYPVPYSRRIKGREESYAARPLKLSTDQWRVVTDCEPDLDGIKIDISLSPEQKPRQGVNTCGANSIFIFDQYPDFIDSRFIFPLATKEIWRAECNMPRKWIFMPYDSTTGRPLSEGEVRSIMGYSYLMKYETELQQRKGTLINTSIGKGVWWALLGVGPYSFAPFKVIWQAYGKHTLDPIILGDLKGQPWQGNQAMHAFIPCWREEDATRICRELKNPRIEKILGQLNGQGKCNFAQPGKMKKLLSFDREVTEQLTLLEPATEYRTRHRS